MEITQEVEAMLEEIRGALAVIVRELKDLRQVIWDLRQKDRISYTIKEAAPLTGLSSETLYNLFRSGKLKGSQSGKGGTIIILRQDLVEFLSSRRVKDIDLLGEPDLSHRIKKSKKYR